jgi:hypothetical protein
MTSLEGWGSAIELRPRDLPGTSGTLRTLDARRQVVTGSVPAPGRCPHRPHGTDG